MRWCVECSPDVGGSRQSSLRPTTMLVAMEELGRSSDEVLEVWRSPGRGLEGQRLSVTADGRFCWRAVAAEEEEAGEGKKEINR